MTVPLVSVVTSVYNGGPALGPSLESVLEQQGVEFELIVVDDGSTDDSPALLDELAGRDPRVRVLHQENQGLTRALIRGCAAARGEFIARHDCDDLSLPGRLERQVQQLQSDSSLSMVSSWATAQGPGDEVLWELRRADEPALATERLLNHGEGPSHHGSVLFRKASYERAGGYRAEFYFAQDSDLWLRLGSVGLLAYEQAILYSFRVSENSISSSYRTVQHQLGDLAKECRVMRCGEIGGRIAPAGSGAATGIGGWRRGRFVGGRLFYRPLSAGAQRSASTLLFPQDHQTPPSSLARLAQPGTKLSALLEFNLSSCAHFQPESVRQGKHFE